MHRPSLSRFAIFMFLSLPLCSGCSGEKQLERAEVFGKVDYNGKPIVEGEITFQPDENTSAPITSGSIIDGEYRVNGKFGVVPGTYVVSVRAYRPLPKSSDFLSPGGLDRPKSVGIVVRDQFLPEKFNTKSSIPKFTVASGQKSIEQNFELHE
jgi:hypothetical protein